MYISNDPILPYLLDSQPLSSFYGKGSRWCCTQQMVILQGIPSSSSRIKDAVTLSGDMELSGIMIYAGCYYFHPHIRREETKVQRMPCS